MQENLQDDSEVVGNDAGLDATPFCKNCASEVPLIIKFVEKSFLVFWGERFYFSMGLLGWNVFWTLFFAL